MGKTRHEMLESLEKNIECFTGESISKKAMEGSEEITEKTDKRKIAEWVKGAMERLDDLVSEKIVITVLADLFEFIEKAADMCADTADYIVMFAGKD